MECMWRFSNKSCISNFLHKNNNLWSRNALKMTNLNKDDIEHYHTDCFENITTSVVQTLCKECSKHFLICLTSFVTQGPIFNFKYYFIFRIIMLQSRPSYLNKIFPIYFYVKLVLCHTIMFGLLAWKFWTYNILKFINSCWPLGFTLVLALRVIFIKIK